jgi:hypothetical protein
VLGEAGAPFSLGLGGASRLGPIDVAHAPSAPASKTAASNGACSAGGRLLGMPKQRQAAGWVSCLTVFYIVNAKLTKIS